MSFIPGANVGPYRIVEQAERNGVATTYTAYQPSLGRYVSVVVVPSLDGDDMSLLRQYQRQIELAMGLRHPNILTVIDHGEHLGVPFVVTELVDAEPLGDRLGAPWPLAEVTRIMRPIAAALDYAHQQGAVHGDLRSSMVLLMPDGTPILSGFGQVTRRLTAPSGVSNGEPGRRTPSVADDIARAQEADRRGLALIAYEMLTGRSVEADPADLDRPLPPAQLGSPLLTPAIEQTFRRELTGDSAERFPSASAFIADLTAPADRETPTVQMPAPLPPTALASGDSRRRLITVALILAALAVLGTLALLLRGGEASRPIASPARATSETVPASTAAAGTTPAGAAPAGTGATGAAAAAGSTGAGRASGAAGPAATPAGAAQSGATAPAGSGQTVISNTPEAAATAATVIVPTPDVAAVGGTPTGAAQPGAGGPQPAASAPQSALTPGAAAIAQQPATAPTPVPTARPGTVTPGPAGSTRLPVTWRVVGDPSGRWALDEQGRVAGRTETGASMVLFPESVDDVGFSANLSTTTCQATLVFRAQDDENLLMAIYIPDGLPNPGTAGGGVWLYQRVEGLDLPIRAVRPSTVRPAGEPVRMKIVTSGPNIAIFLNDEPALQAVDTAPRSGRLGLMVYSTSGRLCEATFGDIER